MDTNTEFSLNLVDLFFHLKKKVIPIMAVTLAAMIIGFAVSSLFIAPKYTATTRMYVLNKSSSAGSISYSDIQISSSFLKDYKVLITGQNVTKEVIAKLGLTMTPSELASMISVTAPDETRVLQISVTDVSAQRAASIANLVREVSGEQIKEIMDVDAVKIVYEADEPTTPSSPNVTKITLLAAAVGFIAMVAIYSVCFALDDTIRTEEDVERYLGISTFGVIPVSSELGSLGKSGKTAQLKPKTKPRK